MKEQYEKILSYLTLQEKDKSMYLSYFENKGFVKYKEVYGTNTLSLLINIKSNRLEEVLKIIRKLNIEFKIIKKNDYETIIELVEKKHYIIIKFVVDSHVIVPKSFLKGWAYPKNGTKCVSYLDVNNNISEAKIKEYGTEFGYYDKRVEDYLAENYESKFSDIKDEINNLYKKKQKEINLNKEKLEIIYNFFDICLYRDPKVTEVMNENSISSKIIGPYSPSDALKIYFESNISNLFKKHKLKLNILLNYTDRKFVLSYNMISEIICDGNIMLILPLNPKTAILLMYEEQYKKYMCNGIMEIVDKEKVIGINKSIYKYSKKNGVDVIGDKKELECLKE